MQSFLFIITISLILGAKILEGGTKTLRVLGCVFILIGAVQGMDLLDNRPSLAEGSLYTIASNMENLESRVKSAEADMLELTEPNLSRQQIWADINLRPSLFSAEDVKKWQDNVPTLAHDFLDSKAVSAMLEIVVGFLLLRLASQNKLLEDLKKHLKVEEV